MLNKSVLIVDDELLIADHIGFMIKEIYSTATIMIAGSSTEALHLLKTNDVDFAFLDIRLGALNEGIDLGKLFNKKQIPFAFLTAYSDSSTITSAIEANPLGYLIKPVSKSELYANLELFFKNIERNNKFKFRQGKEHVSIFENEIFYLTSDGNYAEIHTENDRYILRKSMKSVLGELNVDLIQTHRNFYVNSKHVLKANVSVHLVNGKEIPISRKFKHEVLEKLFAV